MFKRKLTQLEQEIAARRAAGDTDGEAQARGKKAFLHMLSFNIRAAFEEAAKIMALTTGQEEDYAQLAQTLYTQGKLLARQPSQHKAAEEAIFKAYSIFRTLEDRLGEAASLKEWASLNIADGKYKDAMERLDKAIALFDDEGDELELRAELYRLRARCHAHQRNVEPAWADMDKALELAQRSGDRVIIRQVQSERHALSELLAKDEAGE